MEENKINSSLTDLCNGHHITPSQKKFLRKCLYINLIEKNYFCRANFPELSSVNFRQLVHKNQNFIVLAIKSNPCFYRIKGTPEYICRPSLTDNPTGDRMLKILRNIREQPVSFHDIRLKTKSYDFHPLLSQNGHEMDPRNKGILLGPFGFDLNIRAKVHVYPKTINIDVACTNTPLVYDIAGIIHLIFVLGQLYFILRHLTETPGTFSPIGEWILTQFHAGKDGTQAISGETFEITLDEFSTGMIRFYNKMTPDGQRIGRFEQIQTPNTTLIKEIDRIIADSEYRQTTIT